MPSPMILSGRVEPITPSIPTSLSRPWPLALPAEVDADRSQVPAERRDVGTSRGAAVGAADDQVAILGPRQVVGPALATKPVLSHVAVQRIAVVAPVDPVAPRPAEDEVLAPSRADHVVAAPAVDFVVAGAAIDHVAVPGAGEPVCMGVPSIVTRIPSHRDLEWPPGPA